MVNGLKSRGFTLVELLISMAIFSVILVVISQLSGAVLKSWNRSTDSQSHFREARAAFDAISARLSSAELNPYWGFQHPNGNTALSPIGYDQVSDLHFVMGGAEQGNGGTPALLPDQRSPSHAVFFHGSFGRTEERDKLNFGSLLNAWGYFIEFSEDADSQPDFLESEANIDPRPRFRLMELQVPSERLATFQKSLTSQAQSDLAEANNTDELFFWFREGVENGFAVPIANNIIALILTPLPSSRIGGDASDLAPNYYFDSRAKQHSSVPVASEVADVTEHRLPPMVRVTIVAIAEQSALRIAEQNGDSRPDFGLSNLFKDIDDYNKDLEVLEAFLIREQIEYSVYTNTVRLRNALWTQGN